MSDEDRAAVSQGQSGDVGQAGQASFAEADLDGAQFERVSLRGARFTEVRLTGARLHDVDLSGAELRAVSLHRVRMRGVELEEAEISGELDGVRLNGVEVAPLVEAELARRDPDRALMRPTTPDGFARAWAILEARWSATIERARSLPEAVLHERVAGEWSLIETLRHLGFATASWVGGVVLGQTDPFRPLDLPWDEAPGWDGVPWDRAARPTLDEVLADRVARQRLVASVIAGLTAEQLEQRRSNRSAAWPPPEVTPSVAEALRVVLNEEWEHRRYVERDLARLTAQVILVPGLWLTGSVWDTVVSELRERGVSVTALTLPGQDGQQEDGERPATLEGQVEAIVTAVDAAAAAGRRAIVVGHSAAATLAWVAADRRSEAVCGVVLVGGFPSADGEAYADFVTPEDGSVHFPGWSAFAGADSADLDLAEQQALSDVMVPVPEAVTHGVVHLQDERRLDVPVTLVCPEFTPEQAREWLAAGDLPELARAHRLDLVDLDSGRWPMVTRPIRLARIIDDALIAWGSTPLPR